MKTIPLSLFLLLLMAPVEASAEEESFTLRFNPPEVTYDLTVKTTKVKDAGPYGVQTDKGFSKAKITVKKEAGGFTVTSQPVAMELTRNGEIMDDPVQQILLESQLVYHVGPEGHLLTVEGYGDIVAKLQDSLPPEAQTVTAAVFNEAALVRRDTAEWQGRIADFIGQTLSVGDTWTGESDFALPTGETLRYYSTGRVKEAVACGDHPCIKIEFSYSSDAQALAGMMGAVLEAAGGTAPSADADVTQPKIEGEGARIIDPATMLIHEETTVRTITLNMPLPDGTLLPTKMIETKEYSYHYPDGI